MPEGPDLAARLALLAAPLLLTLAASLCWGPLCQGQESLSLDEGPWRLWPDREASWRTDPLFLPGEADPAKLPARPPTGGWKVLDREHGIAVTLPATVEQYFWGAFGWRRYENEYYLETIDDQVRNGSYHGVSWWWRDVEIPARWSGKTLLLHVRGARLRAEVFLNEKLVGYHLIGETPFTCDLTHAARCGKPNRLAFRITNPGGRFDWVDTKLWRWGSYAFYAGHGFGGLDAGLRISAHDPVRLDDLWVLNDPDPHTIHAHARVTNTSRLPCAVRVGLHVADPASAAISGPSLSWKLQLAPGEHRQLSETITWPRAELWNLDHPRLYTMHADLCAQPAVVSPTGWTDHAETTFGFRWFEADGIGRQAVLRLNGRRIRLISAISWGYWGLNGLFPTSDLARREVEAARTLGLNCLQFHRNIGKTEVLDAGDRLGLLRYMEPGGGQSALGERFSLYADSPAGPIDRSGTDGEASTFAERYMEEKIIRMVRAHRGHPSLMIYCLQNEINPDLENPRIFRLLRRIHEEDPSRIVLLKSGIPPTNQAWMQPYSDEVLHDRGDGWSGWRDEHTVGGPGVWRDALYEGPRTFTHSSRVKDEIVVWGEMLGAAVPDNHPSLLAYVEKHGARSYDRVDHEEQLAATEAFLDRWGFRKAFPTAADLLRRIGDKCYDFWGRVIQTARLSETNDYLVISGWESTAIENHSGLVDNVRGFKGRPELMSRRLAPLAVAVQPLSLVWQLGERARFDLFLINETGRPAGTRVTLSLETPGGKTEGLGRLAISEQTPDRFVYPAGEGLVTPPLEREGRAVLVATLEGTPQVTSREELLVVDPAPALGKTVRVAVLSEGEALRDALGRIPGVEVKRFAAGGAADLIVAGCMARTGRFARVEPEREIEGTGEDELYRTIEYGEAGDFDYRFEVPPGHARVTLKFAEMFADKPGERVFDVAVNDQVVLPEFDVLAAAGGKNIAHDRVIEVEAPEGVVRITVPRVVRGSARFCALKVEAAGTVHAINCGGSPYTDREGVTWGRQPLGVSLSEALLEQVRRGTPLLVWSEGARAAIGYAEQLAAAAPPSTRQFRCLGEVGTARASWMGAWFFTRAHPLLDGLQSDGVMRSYFQAPTTDANGVLIEGEGTEIVIAYGRDHDRRIGAAGYTGHLGRGRFLALNLPGLLSSLDGRSRGIHPLVARRMLANAVACLTGAR